MADNHSVLAKELNSLLAIYTLKIVKLISYKNIIATEIAALTKEIERNKEELASKNMTKDQLVVQEAQSTGSIIDVNSLSDRKRIIKEIRNDIVELENTLEKKREEAEQRDRENADITSMIYFFNKKKEKIKYILEDVNLTE